MSLIGQKELDELKDYAELCNDEMGEACELLLQIYGYGDYLSEDFNDAVEGEILNVLHFFKQNYVIEIREMPPMPPMKTRELVEREKSEEE